MPQPARQLRRVSVPALVLLVAVSLLAACGQARQPAQPRAKLTPPAGLVDGFSHYVALGDSYTAAPFVPGRGTGAPCFRSSNNYPSLIARSLHVPDFTDRSCGGARTTDVTGAQYPSVPPQLTALDDRTDLVTLGIGANDGDLAKALIGICPGMGTVTRHGAPCRDLMRESGTDRLLAAIPGIGRRVEAILREVHRRSPHAEVAVVGYPRIAPEHGTCRALPLAKGDYAYAGVVLRHLNHALARAARVTGSTWVGLWAASRGHDICADDPWIEGAYSDNTRAAAYHPFEEEQVAVARLVERALARS